MGMWHYNGQNEDVKGGSKNVTTLSDLSPKTEDKKVEEKPKKVKKAE